MPKTIKEVYTDYTGNTTVEYSDDSTRKYSVDDVPVVSTNQITGGDVLQAGVKSFQFGSYDSVATNKLPKFKAAIAKVRAGTTTLGTNTLNINKVADGNVIILAVRTYRAAASAVEIINAGWGGSKAADWAASANVWDPVNGINSLAPDLTVINLTINDWIAATTPSAVVTSTQTIIAAARNSGDVILCTGFPSSTSSASRANQEALVQAIRPVAMNYGVPLLDFYAYWGDYTTAVTNGLFLPANDPIHPGSPGYGHAAYAIGTIFGST